MPRVSIGEIAAGRNSDGFLLGLNGASVQVNIAGGGAATVYAADTGGTTLTNPLTSSNGRITGWVTEGAYDLIITYGGVTAPAVRFEARSAYPSGATDGQVLVWSAGTSSVVWTDLSAITAGMPWTIDIDPFMPPATQTTWSTLTVTSVALQNGYLNSASTVGSVVGWDVVLAAGTWNVSVLYLRDVNMGIFTVALDAVTAGTIDAYGTNAANQIGTASGITVATTGKKRLTLTIATKNASSSAFNGYIQAVRLRRTA